MGNSRFKKDQDDREKRFWKYFGIEYPYVKPKKQYEKITDKTKTLVSADIHEPYSSIQALREMLKHKDAETHIVAGDIGDYYSKSRFNKTKHQNFKDEVRAVFYRLEWLSTHWKNVKVMIGNHDNRPEKFIIGKFQDGAVDLLVLTEDNILKRLASQFDNIEIVGHQINTDINLTHIYQYHDVIVTHAEVSMKQNSAILERISLYLNNWKKQLGLKPYKVILQAHNHRADKTFSDGELRMLIPTASEPASIGFEYIYTSRLIGTPPQLGFTLLYQNNGITDVNKTNYIVLNH